MNFPEFLVRYQGTALTAQDISQYEEASFSFYHDTQIIREPYIHFTLQIEVGEAYQYFQDVISIWPEASFFRFMVWLLSREFNQTPSFNFRKFDNDWYVFRRLPISELIFIPNTNGMSSFFTEDIDVMDLNEFFIYSQERWRQVVENVDPQPISALTWYMAPIFCHLPEARFTSFTLPLSHPNCGVPRFCFGKVYKQSDAYLIPLSISIDRAILSPHFVIDRIQDILSNPFSTPNV
ncbi:MAG TPA: hypothetical protein DCR93_12655 [Cytophagales bacterium]|nr:hypothetical protein [Cytophagales bacterium]HAP60296.1 hypothetical protein [Cytophagales bacterium]